MTTQNPEQKIQDQKRFSLIQRAKSFTHAGRGIWVFIRSTHNAWIHILVLVCVVLFGLYFNVTQVEWFALIFACGLVLTAEAFNTAIEIDIDLTSPEYHPYAKDSKDVAAGAVLISACTAFIVGLIVFVPYVASYFVPVAQVSSTVKVTKDSSTIRDRSLDTSVSQSSTIKADIEYFKNATYIIDNQSFTLKNGVSEVASAPGSASKIITRYFGNEAVGDLNGDGQPDVAFLVTQSTGGTGLFYYAVVALRKSDKKEIGVTDSAVNTSPAYTKYKMTNAFFVGDRIAPQSTVIQVDSHELQINYVERKKDEPISSVPSVGATLLLKVTPNGVLEGLMK